MYEIDTKTGGHDMTTIYRGVEVAPLNNAAGSETPANTVYRGVQQKIVESSQLSQVKEFTAASKELVNFY